MIDFVGKRYWFYLFSMLVVIPGTISLILPNGIREGIEFGSGTTFGFRFEQPVETEALRSALAELGHPDARIQRTRDGKFLVRTRVLEGGVTAPAIGPAPPSERENLESALEERFGTLVDSDGQPIHRFLEFSSVSASVSSDIVRNAALAVAFASLAILVYITLSFISVEQPVRFGVSAIVALLHDVLLVMGVASIFGRLFDFEIDTLFITAMLTIVGFSVHDSIVVFDRVRENARRAAAAGADVTLAETVNASLNQTLGRSLNTSITVVLTLIALILLGGETVRDFLIIMLIGLISGTYSSIFVASQLLVSWEEGDFAGLLPWRGGRTEEQPA
ncbi:MAG TPA: protein translocase subunit SecF [Dehalococcoidia bacterium]|nr:protein translocase subunit SecF [Dehalococcoidia bacterium]